MVTWTHLGAHLTRILQRISGTCNPKCLKLVSEWGESKYFCTIPVCSFRPCFEILGEKPWVNSVSSKMCPKQMCWGVTATGDRKTLLTPGQGGWGAGPSVGSFWGETSTQCASVSAQFPLSKAIVCESYFLDLLLFPVATWLFVSCGIVSGVSGSV